MANTIPASLNGQIVTDLFFQAFLDTLVPINRFSTDFGGDLGHGNKTAEVPVYGAKSSSNFAGNYTTGSDSTVTNVEVIVNKHKFTSVHITDTEAANSKAANLRNLAIQAGQGLAKDVLQDIWSLILNANYSTPITQAVGTFDSDDVTDIKNQCDTDKMPSVGRTLVLADGHYNALLKDTSIKNANHYGSDIAIRSGHIPNLVGFEVFQSSAVPDNGENLVGFAATPSAIAIAMRYLVPQNPSMYTSTMRLQDPTTGIVVGVREFGLPDTGTNYLVFECNYGSAVGQDDALTRLVSA